MKVLVSDLDGTIIINKKISDFDRSHIYKFINDKDNKFIIATGRSYVAFKRAIKKYNLDFFDYAVLSNGATLIDNCGNIIFKKAMEEQSVYEIFNFISKIMIDGSSLFVATLEFEEKLKSKQEVISYIEEKLQSIKDQVISLTIELPTSDIDLAKKITNELQELPYSKYTSVSRNSRYIDIVHEGISKKSSAHMIIAKYDYKQEDIAAIGDGQNDINILLMTDNSFTFDRSEQIVKDNAKYIVSNIGECIDHIYF